MVKGAVMVESVANKSTMECPVDDMALRRSAHKRSKSALVLGNQFRCAVRYLASNRANRRHKSISTVCQQLVGRSSAVVVLALLIASSIMFLLEPSTLLARAHNALL